MNPRQAEHMVLHGFSGAQIYKMLVIMSCISVKDELTPFAPAGPRISDGICP